MFPFSIYDGGWIAGAVFESRFAEKFSIKVWLKFFNQGLIEK